MTISSWNINGVYRKLNGQRVCKLDNDEFKQTMVSDIIFLCETHLAYSDSLYYDGYKYIPNCRSAETSRLKGGLGLLVKQTLINGVKVIDKSCNEYIWVKLCHNFFGLQRDIYICFLYIPPVNSSYTKRTGLDKSIFDDLESNIGRWGSKGDIILMGDFNAHVNSNDLDFIEMDFHDTLNDSLPQMYISDNVLQKRNTQLNQITNAYGRQLLELCTSSQLRILNGRVIGDTMGRITFFNSQGTSIDDYCVCSEQLLSTVCSFEVGDFTPTLSDHCAITLTLQGYFFDTPEITLRNIYTPKWSDKKEELFRSKLNKVEMNEVIEQATSAHLSGERNKSCINGAITAFTGVLQRAAFGSERRPIRNKRRKDKPWFNHDCRIKLRFIRSLCKRLKGNPWDINLRLKVMYEKKMFKKGIRKNHRLYKQRILDRLMSNENNDSPNFWRLINKIKKKEENDMSMNISAKEWVQYFTNLMNVTQKDNFLLDNEPEYSFTSCNLDILNADITGDEVLKALKCLKRNKACGPDNILNEMIITSCQYDVNVFVKLFNMILSTGVFPDTWRDNLIKPILKGGSCNDP